MSSVSSDPNSNVLTFAVTGRHPSLATRLVNAYVDGYAAYSAEQLTAKINLAILDETQKIDSLNRQIAARKKKGASSGTLYPELHGLLEQRTTNQQTLNELSATGGAQVVRRAQGASQTQPTPIRNAAIGFALGLVLGIALALLRKALDTRVRSATEIANGLGIPLLSRVPTPPKRLAANYKLAMLSESDQTHLEAHRKLRVAVDYANSSVNAKVIMVTSAIEQEGKSTTVANLAVAMARAGRNTVLVDLDLRKPALARFFDLGDRVGMTDVALGYATLEEALVPIVIPNDGAKPLQSDNGNGAGVLDGILKVVPAGRLQPDPVDFLSSKRVSHLLAQIGKEADIVLVDSAPLLPVADGVPLSNHVDAIIVIAKAVLLRRSMLGEMRRLLATCHGAKLGFVLAGAEAEDGYGYGYGDYGYDGGASVSKTQRSEVARLTSD